ncbi:hypothetical protein SEA_SERENDIPITOUS_93 [Mycobacterium phage Serendipitous]|uniref:Uncharacterized protein n=1 Tax=Mycobacterium phage Serendipitous TaxID=2301619 RepID=A0A385UJY7_9CAUD|nr:hypothetical protein I5G64_gp93 [Mycobacterium phage Serendipitous]AYB70634.1 hypothetical protein SEA_SERENDIPITOUS_93 [Mycobacterium phage Serendipitous]
MTVRTAIVTHWSTSNEEDGYSILDSMLSAQHMHGQITWTDIHETWAAGTVGGDEGSRVTVIDLDSTDGSDIVNLTLWAADPTQGTDLPK